MKSYKFVFKNGEHGWRSVQGLSDHLPVEFDAMGWPSDGPLSVLDISHKEAISIAADDLMSGDLAICPHPEWLGIWDRSGVSVFGVIKITWENGVFMGETNEHKSEVVECWDGPYEGWKLIEPAPLEARAHTKPKETINVGWDPYGEG